MSLALYMENNQSPMEDLLNAIQVDRVLRGELHRLLYHFYGPSVRFL